MLCGTQGLVPHARFSQCVAFDCADSARRARMRRRQSRERTAAAHDAERKVSPCPCLYRACPCRTRTQGFRRARCARHVCALSRVPQHRRTEARQPAQAAAHRKFHWIAGQTRPRRARSGHRRLHNARAARAQCGIALCYTVDLTANLLNLTAVPVSARKDLSIGPCAMSARSQ